MRLHKVTMMQIVATPNFPGKNYMCMKHTWQFCHLDVWHTHIVGGEVCAVFSHAPKPTWCAQLTIISTTIWTWLLPHQNLFSMLQLSNESLLFLELWQKKEFGEEGWQEVFFLCWILFKAIQDFSNIKICAGWIMLMLCTFNQNKSGQWPLGDETQKTWQKEG